MPDTATKPLDLAEVKARIERHRCNAPRSGDTGFLEVSQILDHDAPALVDEVERLRGLIERLVTAAEDILVEAEADETAAVFDGTADPARLGTPARKRLREAINTVPADALTLPAAGAPETPENVTDEPQPVPMTRGQLLRILDDLRARIAIGDSDEGHLTYMLPADPAADFDVRAGYRVGNRFGQGGFRVIGRQSALNKPGEETP